MTTTMPTAPPVAPAPAAYPPAAAVSSRAAGGGPDDGDPPLHRWTLEEYERAVALGAFTPDLRVELIDGLITEKMPNDPPYADTANWTAESFSARSGNRWLTRCQLPVRLPGQGSEPEPDVALVCIPPGGRYRGRHPEPTDIFLLIEVADSSLLTDRKTKGPLYARANIPEYWIVNVPERTVEVFRDPDPETGVYRAATVARPGETVAPAAFPDAALAVAEWFEA